jgi:hypothetical protein
MNYSIINLTLFFINVFISSCGLSRYESWQKRKQLIRKEYTIFKDTIYISDVILCNSYSKGFWGELKTPSINEDSVFNIFLSSLNKLSLPFKVVEKITFHCDPVFTQSSKNFHMLTISDEEIRKLATLNPNRYKMIPFIRLNIQDVNFISVTASSYSPTGGSKRHPIVGIVVYLFENSELIYLRMFNFSGKPIDIYTDENGRAFDLISENPVVNTIEQKHWDKLVELVMRDYIKRMK